MSAGTAAERLERILYILPAAQRPGGVQLEELAATLGVSVPVVLSDIEAVTAREYYHPAGSTDALCIRIERGRVLLDGGAGFERPARLTPREALAVHLGLHALAAECTPERRERALRLGARLAAALRAPSAEARHPPNPPGRRVPELEYEPEQQRALLLGFADDVLRGLLSDAITERQAVRLLYLKPGAEQPETRHVAPQLLAYADGAWYALAQDLERRTHRIFRLDRVLSAEHTGPAGDIAAERDWIAQIASSGAAPFLAEAEQQVTVRYAPAIARWIAERAAVAPDADGSIAICHRVADTRWIVRHVLQFAGAAWIEEPESLRELLARRALELSGPYQEQAG